MLVPLRKQMILKYELPYPSGTATGALPASSAVSRGVEP